MKENNFDFLRHFGAFYSGLIELDTLILGNTNHNIQLSMNRPGCCIDNAEVESFFHSLKADLIRVYKFETTSKLQSRLKGYLNFFTIDYDCIRV